MRFDSPADLLGAAGTDLGVSDWLVVDQARIDRFAEATDDHQWIHVDPERAKDGPYGATIAYGYLTLALLAPIMFQLLDVGGTAVIVNAGSDRVRYLTPVVSGARIRGRATLVDAERIPSGVRARTAVTVEVEGGEKPALVAETLTVFVPEGRAG